MEKIIETDFGRINRVFFNKNTGKYGSSLKSVYNGEKVSKTSINWFFTLGYIPGNLTLYEQIECLQGGARYILKNNKLTLDKLDSYDSLIDKKSKVHLNKSKIIKISSKIFENSVKSLLNNLGECKTIFLTAGIDSRAILLSLLKHYDGPEINTITFGYEKGFDIKIARKVAKKYNLNHHEFILDNYVLDIDYLYNFINISDGLVNLFSLPPYEEIINLIKSYGDSVWSGIGGGSSMGSNLPLKNISENPILSLINRNLERVNNLIMAPASIINDYPNYNDVYDLMKYNKTHDGIDFENHTEKLCGPTMLLKNITNYCPFINKLWLSHWFSLPNKYRYKRNLCEEFLLSIDKNALKIESSYLNNKNRYIIRKLKHYLRYKKYPYGKRKLLTHENLKNNNFKNMIKGLDIPIDYNKKQLNQNEYFEQIIISIALIDKYYKKSISEKNIL